MKKLRNIDVMGYEAEEFDKWLEESTKQEILHDLEERWQRQTNGNAIFISAIERSNIDVVRQRILEKVRELYRVRFPYKSEFFY